MVFFSYKEKRVYNISFSEVAVNESHFSDLESEATDEDSSIHDGMAPINDGSPEVRGHMLTNNKK